MIDEHTGYRGEAGVPVEAIEIIDSNVLASRFYSLFSVFSISTPAINL